MFLDIYSFGFFLNFIGQGITVFNRAGVAGTVLQTPPSPIKWVGQQSFSSRSSKHHNYQSVKARQLTFWDNIHSHQLWHVRCHVSCVTLFVLLFFSFFCSKWWGLLVECLLSMGHTPSSFLKNIFQRIHFVIIL